MRFIYFFLMFSVPFFYFFIFIICHKQIEKFSKFHFQKWSSPIREYYSSTHHPPNFIFSFSVEFPPSFPNSQFGLFPSFSKSIQINPSIFCSNILLPAAANPSAFSPQNQMHFPIPNIPIFIAVAVFLHSRQ